VIPQRCQYISQSYHTNNRWRNSGFICESLKSSQGSGCTHIDHTGGKSCKQMFVCLQESWWQLFSETEHGRNVGSVIHARWDHSNVRSISSDTKELHMTIQKKRCGTTLTSDVVLLHDNAHPNTATCTWTQLGAVWPPFLQPWSCFKQLPPVYLAEELVEITALRQEWGVDGMCQNVAELTGGRLLRHRHRKTYSLMGQVPQFWQQEVA
jgi:hypothetical protein